MTWLNSIMGYRSDVGIIVAFKTRHGEGNPTKMNVDVQRRGVVNYHRVVTPIRLGYKVFFLQYKNEHVKWYDDYDDVVGIRHLTKLASNFGEEQGMHYAWKELNVGEDGAIHYEEDSKDPEGSTSYQAL